MKTFPQESQSTLARLARALNNWNDDAMIWANEALNDDRPAFWTVSRYSSSIARGFPDAAHLRGPSAAIAEVRNHYRMWGETKISVETRAVLDRTIPLNIQAAAALSGFYAELGDFVPVDETMRRIDLALAGRLDNLGHMKGAA